MSFRSERMAKILGVSCSGYYAWLKRPESRSSRENRRLDALIRAEFEASRQHSGSVKITRALQNRGEWVNRKRVAKRMQRMELQSRVRRKYRPTTDSKHSHPVTQNLPNRQFTVTEPNLVWVSDISYLWTAEEGVYLTSVSYPLLSNGGGMISISLSHESFLRALWQAVGKRRPLRGLMIHSDRGVQDACDGFRSCLGQLHFFQSMSRKGNCWDNAVAEPFFRTLKTEWYYGMQLLDINHARRELFEYIELFYNARRLHAGLDYVSPQAFEAQGVTKCA